MILRLVIYDIEDDNYRNKISKKLLVFGFEHIQKSVFCGSHNLTQWQQCWETLQKLHQKLGKEKDKIYAIVISRKMFGAIQCMGEPPEKEKILNEVNTLWI